MKSQLRKNAEILAKAGETLAKAYVKERLLANRYRKALAYIEATGKNSEHNGKGQLKGIACPCGWCMALEAAAALTLEPRRKE